MISDDDRRAVLREAMAALVPLEGVVPGGAWPALHAIAALDDELSAELRLVPRQMPLVRRLMMSHRAVSP